MCACLPVCNVQCACLCEKPHVGARVFVKATLSTFVFVCVLCVHACACVCVSGVLPAFVSLGSGVCAFLHECVCVCVCVCVCCVDVRLGVHLLACLSVGSDRVRAYTRA